MFGVATTFSRSAVLRTLPAPRMAVPSVGVVPMQSMSTQIRMSDATSLQERVSQLVPEWRTRYQTLRKTKADASLGNVTVAQALGGMRGIKGLVWEPSLLDPVEGIRYRGLTLPEVQEHLPKAKGGSQALPEATLWLLMTGEVPSAAQAEALSRDLAKRARLTDDAYHVINHLPANMHSMAQLCSGVLACQPDSQFASLYSQGKISKANMWESTLEDVLNLIARLPRIASLIYRNKYHNRNDIPANPDLDWGANFAQMLGMQDPMFTECMRMYLTIHADHEGGNASAHSCHLVGSTLSDPYLSFVGGMTALAGPLHGLANQEVLAWIKAFKEKLGTDNWTKEQLEQACWDTLNSGKVIPGYGHAVLVKTDPRYTEQRKFALKHLGDDTLFRLVRDLYEVVPDVLAKHGKAKNPWPNVDAHSGVLLQYYGLTEESYYTVLFGVSRALGVLSQLVISRAVGLPIERPKSITPEWIEQNV